MTWKDDVLSRKPSKRDSWILHGASLALGILIGAGTVYFQLDVISPRFTFNPVVSGYAKTRSDWWSSQSQIVNSFVTEKDIGKNHCTVSTTEIRACEGK